MKKNIIKISLAGVVVGVAVSTASFSVAASAVPTESPVESTKEYDDIQKMFLAIDKDTTEDDLLKLIEEYEVAYTAEDYNGTPKKRCYNIAFEEGAALQRYANPGDTKGGITMKYSNGNTKETGYHSVDSAEDALGDILS